MPKTVDQSRFGRRPKSVRWVAPDALIVRSGRQLRVKIRELPPYSTHAAFAMP